MRLTLRTLLAYLDQILDEQDTQELGRKIHESEIAGQLVHRIRRVLTQRGDAGIAVSATEPGYEANQVAQYLDNTLAPEQMADFERICLDSDSNLAEVAACHQILTLVLGEPASVPDALRQRIYRLDSGAASVDDQLGAVTDASHGSPSSGKSARPQADFGGLASEAKEAAESRPADLPTGLQTSWKAAPRQTDTAAESSDRTASAPDNQSPKSSKSDAPGHVPSGRTAPTTGNVSRRIDPAVPTNRSGTDTATAEAASDWVDDDEHWKTAPDYLKRPRNGRWKPVLLTTLIAFCLAMAGLRGMGPLDSTHPLARQFGWTKPDQSTLAEGPDELVAGTDVAVAASPAVELSAEAAVVETIAGEDTQMMPAEIDAADVEPADVEPATADPAEMAQFDEQPTPERVAAELDQPAPDNGPDLPPDIAQVPQDDAVSQADDGPQGDEVLAADAQDQLDRLPQAAPAESAAPDAIASEVAPVADDLAATDRRSANAGLEPDEGAIADAVVGEDALPELPGPAELTDNANDVARTDPNADAAEPQRPALIDPLANLDRAGRPVPEAMPTAVAADQPSADAAERARPVEIGRFLDPQQILIRQDPASELWRRVPVGTLLQAGDQLMSLPTFRTPLALASGMQVTLIGATQLDVLPSTTAATPEFQLDFGRLTVATFAQAGTTFQLRWDDQHEGQLTLADMNTIVAVELQRHRLPGSDPIERPAYRVLQIYVTSGGAEWQADESAPIQLLAGQRLTMVEELPPQLTDIDEMPAWIDGRDARPRDPIAARKLSEQISPDRPVTLVLQEESNSKFLEVRSLAASSLAYLGDVAPLLLALNDPALRSYWNAEYEILMDVVSLSPDAAAQLRSAIYQRHGETMGESFYRMLWGFSPDQLARGAAEQLVNALDHPSFDFRIVASETLKSITELPTLYRAHAGPREPQRRAATVRWRKHLQDGEIVYKQMPEIVTWLQAAGEAESSEETP